MKADLHKKKLGYGMYTVSDISQILNLPKFKVRRYLTEYWDNRFGNRMMDDSYSWQTGNIKIVNFFLLIEFFTVFKLKELGVNTRQILNSRESISRDLQIPYPFASLSLLTDGKGIWYRFQDSIIKADGKKQLYFNSIMEEFCEKIDFNGEKIAQRFWPRGRESSILVDPHHQFGQPIISGTNINAEAIYSMYNSGEDIQTLVVLYNLSEQEVKDAINFYQNAA